MVELADWTLSKKVFSSPIVNVGSQCGRARIGEALATLMQIYDLTVVTLDHHALILDDIMIAIEGDDVGYSEGLPGHNQEVAVLKSDVGDRRIADDDFGRRPRKP